MAAYPKSRADWNFFAVSALASCYLAKTKEFGAAVGMFPVLQFLVVAAAGT
jgi:hypothetical protein